MVLMYHSVNNAKRKPTYNSTDGNIQTRVGHMSFPDTKSADTYLRNPLFIPKCDELVEISANV